MQFDLFSSAEDLPIAPRHPVNPRCFAIEYTRIERFDGGEFKTIPSGTARIYVEIRIARDKLGYHWGVNYSAPDAYSSGPVFPRRNPASSYGEARAIAIEELRAKRLPEKCQKILERMK